MLSGPEKLSGHEAKTIHSLDCTHFDPKIVQSFLQMEWYITKKSRALITL